MKTPKLNTPIVDDKTMKSTIPLKLIDAAKFNKLSKMKTKYSYHPERLGYHPWEIERMGNSTNYNLVSWDKDREFNYDVASDMLPPIACAIKQLKPAMDALWRSFIHTKDYNVVMQYAPWGPDTNKAMEVLLAAGLVDKEELP